MNTSHLLLCCAFFASSLTISTRPSSSERTNPEESLKKPTTKLPQFDPEKPFPWGERINLAKAVIDGGDLFARPHKEQLAGAHRLHWVNLRVGKISIGSRRAGSPGRWWVRDQRYWSEDATEFGFSAGLGPREALDCYRLAELRTGKLAIGTDKGPHELRSGHQGTFLYNYEPVTRVRYAKMLWNNDKEAAELEHAITPIAEDQLRLFILTNVPGGLLKPAGKSDNLTGLVGTYTGEKGEQTKPVWTLRVFTYKGKWEAKDRKWGKGEWKQEEVLPAPPLRERFHAFDHQGTYTFVTDSGKAYLAPPPAKGKPRAVTAIWDDPKRPVVAAITDNATGRTFLFAQPRDATTGAYFLPEAKPKLTEYDRAKVKPFDKAKGQLRQVVELTRVLLADKQINLKEAKQGD